MREKEEEQVIIDAVRQVQLGRNDHFEVIVKEYEQRIRSYCSMMLKNTSAGEDAAQELFLKAFQHIGSFRGKSPFVIWLFTLARNHCIDVLRRDKTINSLIIREENKSDAHQQGITERAYTLEDRLAATELLQQVLSMLSPMHREILLLRELYGFNYEELAQILSLSVDGVKGQLKRARASAEKVFYDDITKADRETVDGERL